MMVKYDGGRHFSPSFTPSERFSSACQDSIFDPASRYKKQCLMLGIADWIKSSCGLQLAVSMVKDRRCKPSGANELKQLSL